MSLHSLPSRFISPAHRRMGSRITDDLPKAFALGPSLAVTATKCAAVIGALLIARIVSSIFSDQIPDTTLNPSSFASQNISNQNPFLESILSYVPPGCFNDLRCVGPFMRIGAGVNVYDVNGTTPLHKAISAKSEAVFDALVAANANISALTKDLQFSPLLLATVQNCTNLVKKLLDAGANPNIPNAVGQTPIFFAQDPRAAQLLVDKGANVNITSQLGIPPLFAAINTNSSAIVDVLVKAGADLNYVGPYPKSYTFESIRCNNSDGATGCFKGGTPLVFAIFERNLPIIAQFTEAGADVNHVDARHTHRTPLIAALLTENLDAVNLVIKAGADINYTNNEPTIFPPISIAIDMGNAEMVQRLISAGADVNLVMRNNQGRLYSPLGQAITSAYTDQEIVELLLEAGAKLIDSDINDKKCALPLYHDDIKLTKAKTVERYLKHGHEPFNNFYGTADYEDWLRQRTDAGKLT